MESGNVDNTDSNHDDGDATKKEGTEKMKNATEMRSVSPSLEKEWRESFCMFDKDGDGRITGEELASVMRALGDNPTDEDLKAMMDELDEDKNGTIELDEFLDIMYRHWKDPEDEAKELMDAFKVFDKNNDGFVDMNEIKEVMCKLGHSLTDEEVSDIIRENDEDNDGKLAYEEFVKAMMRRS